jgi:IclR family acetate operon transcriptional repressor
MTRSLGRGLEILEMLARSDIPCGVSDLARRLGIDKATVHRLLKVLDVHGYVQRDWSTRRYSCSPRILELSAQLLAHMSLPLQARPYLKELVDGTGLSAHLAVLARSTLQWAVYVADERSASHVQVDVRVGQMAPTHCTAVGKALIAYVAGPLLQTLAHRGALRKFTSTTITDYGALVSHLRKVRERGYAIDDEEFHVDIRCVGAAVRDHDRHVIASIGVSGIVTELRKESIPKTAAVVTDVADRLSRAIGFSQVTPLSHAFV